jgi:hypothetical protein
LLGRNAVSQPKDALPERPFADHKAHDRALILPIVGLLLLIPPIADLFQLETRIAGVPFTALYLFVVWGALIAGAFALSRRLRDGDRSVDDSLSAGNTRH